MTTFRAAAVQMRSGVSPAANVAAATELLRAATAEGAAYVLTGSVNQAAVESGLHAEGKEMLAHAGIAERTHSQYPRAFTVALECIAYGALDRPLVAVQSHIDEITNDKTAQIAKAKLSRDLLGGFNVQLIGHLLGVAGCTKPSAVHVDGYHRFGTVDDDRTTGG